LEKQEQKELFIYGKQAVFEVLKSDHPVNEVVLAREMDRKDAEKIHYLSGKRNIKVTYDLKANLQKLCGPVPHQGVVAIIDEFRYLNEKRFIESIQSFQDPFVLILDQIQDPHNLGAIARTAEIAGITAIILPEKGSSSVTSTVAKTSAGAVFHCPIHRTENLPNVMEKLHQKSFMIIAMVPHQQDTIYDTDLRGPLAIVVGSEGKGVRKNIQRLCDKSMSIPGWGKVDSLNVSVSTAVVVFEAVRQRMKKVEGY
jgi:23S rRNA (guanosine2251-2'-O)-methyltransferase